jgi:hypothetical protein
VDPTNPISVFIGILDSTGDRDVVADAFMEENGTQRL